MGTPKLKKSLFQQATANLTEADTVLLRLLNDINSTGLDSFVKANYSEIRNVPIPDGEFAMAHNATKQASAQWGLISKTSIMKTLNEGIEGKIEAGLARKAGVAEISRDIRKLLIGEKNSRSIARTETARIFNTAKAEAMTQIQTNGHGTLKKYWIPGASGDERDWHTALGSLEPQELDYEYELIAPDGSVEFAKHPHDSNLSAINVINCRCTIGEIFEAGV